MLPFLVDCPRLAAAGIVAPCRLFRRLEGAMTVAELIEKLSALLDKTGRVVKSPGPWDDLNEPSVNDGYVDKDMQFSGSGY
jgi:hypothetical protein